LPPRPSSHSSISFGLARSVSVVYAAPSPHEFHSQLEIQLSLSLALPSSHCSKPLWFSQSFIGLRSSSSHSTPASSSMSQTWPPLPSSQSGSLSRTYGLPSPQVFQLQLDVQWSVSIPFPSSQ